MKSEFQQRATQKAETDRPNLTGIPTQMKLNFEQHSGISFDDVRVHYGSDRPAQLRALAYTQGRHVYIGPGQERHLGHELGHIIQQKLGQVAPTGRVGGLPINDDRKLEADRLAGLADRPDGPGAAGPTGGGPRRGAGRRTEGGAPCVPEFDLQICEYFQFDRECALELAKRNGLAEVL